MRCSKCETDNPSANKFCARCGERLAQRCAKCGTENPGTSNFCSQCGASLAALASARGAAGAIPEKAPGETRLAERPGAPTDPIEAAQPAAEARGNGERKTVTALFADIKGSMELMEDLDPEEARAIVDPALKLMIDAVHRYDGYVVQSTGDGIFALFGAPVAHEDHPQRALYAALRMQEQIKHYSSKLIADGGTPLEARVGANTGEVVVRALETGSGHAEYTPIGHTTNLASRMQAVAPTGSIAISENTRRLVEGYFQLKPRGPTRIKGASEPVNVYEVAGLGPLRTRLQRAAGRGLTKFVGREREIETMRRAADLALHGQGQIVAAVAEAGVGKSRLFHEFKMRNQSGWMVLEAFSVSHGKASAYLPVVDLLHSYFAIEREDDERRRREKVNGRIITLDPALEEVRPYLLALLGLVEGEDPLARMDAEMRRRRTFDAIKRLLLRESLNQPLMVVFEDLHWIDSETQGLLDLLAASIDTARLLLLVNYRPEYVDTWRGMNCYTQMRLEPLGGESAAEMLSALLGTDRSLEAIKRLIVGRTEGNPFFMEEIVQALFEEGALVRNGAVRAAKPVTDFRLPPTVQGILAARIDRLPPADKDLLQTMAVIGREFPQRLSASVTGGPPSELEAQLANLQAAEFVYEQPAAGDVEYSFKHALTQEVAYNSMLSERRKLLHQRIAGAIEGLYAGRLDDHLAELAHHYVRAGHADKATQYVALAAQQAIRSGALGEAIAGLQRGLPLLEGIAEATLRARREAVLQVTLGSALQRRNPAGEGVEAAYLRARELCVGTGDDQLLFSAGAGLRLFYNFRAQLDRALELAMEMLKAAERAGEPGMLVAAHSHLSQTLYFRGELTAAREHVERSVRAREYFEQTRASSGPGAGLLDLLFLGDVIGRRMLILALLGYPTQADPASVPAPSSRMIPPFLHELFVSQIYYLLRDPARAARHAERGIDLARDSGSHQALGYLASSHGWAVAALGDVAAGLAEINRGISILDRAGARLRTLPFAALVDCHVMRGSLSEGLGILSAAIEHVERTGERFLEAEFHRLRGEMLARIGPGRRPEAEAAFRTAIRVARGQRARWFELRGTVGLARLLRDSDRGDQARPMLAEIYDWFTEGFDTPDLKDAKALLDELSARGDWPGAG